MTDEKILKYIKGDLSSDEKKLFLDWVNDSTENKEHYKQIRKLWDFSLLTTEPDACDHREAYGKIKSRIHSRGKKNKIDNGNHHRIVTDIMKAAAIIVVTFGIAWYMFNRPQPELPVAYNHIEVPTGQRVKLDLSDGSTIWLNAGTKFTYPDKFSKTERKVILDGEAQFNVKRSETHPFMVQTATYSVTALGTKFNVYAYDEASKFEATLLNGSVLLQKGNCPQNEIALRPGQQAVYDKNAKGVTVLNNVDTADISSWVKGYHCFNKATFRDMTERLSHYYEKKIIVKYPAILDYECTGKFRHEESLEHILNVVKISKPFKYKTSEDEVIIY